jgi:tetratricopeptide (TPR) repeat protein
MFEAIRFRHLIVAGALLLGVMLSSLAGNAQLPPPPPTPCGSREACAGGASGGNNGDGGPIGEILGIPGDIIRAHDKAKEAKLAKQRAALNDQGIASYNSKDWAAAEANFKECLKYYPNDQVVLRNLALTQGQEGEDAYRRGDYATALNYFQQALANDPIDDQAKRILNDDLAVAKGKIANVQRDKVAAANIQQTVQNLAQSLTAAPSPNTKPSPGGLDFSDGGPTSNSDNSGGLSFTASDPSLKDSVADKSGQPSAGGSTNAFGTNSNPSNPDLDHSAPAPAVAVHNASDQASSAANSGAAAETNGRSDDAKAKSGCAFDTGACAAYTPVRVDKNVAQTPGAAEVASHIPAAARNDPEIQKDLAFYEKTDGEKIDTKTKLAAIQNQIDSHTGDTQVLNAQKATLSNDLKRYDTDEANTQAQIKKRLVSVDVPWVETPAPPATSAATAKP